MVTLSAFTITWPSLRRYGKNASSSQSTSTMLIVS